MPLELAGPYTLTVGDYPDTDAVLVTGLIRGVILDVGLKFTFDGGSSMGIEIITSGAFLPAVPILSITSADTDGWFSPRAPIHDPSDGSVIANLTNGGISVYDTVTIGVSNAGAGDMLEVWFMLST